MKSISSYEPSHPAATAARVLLLGPVGSGKSSFISSVQSVFSGRVTHRAMVGSFSTSFTKKVGEAASNGGLTLARRPLSHSLVLGPATVLPDPRRGGRAAAWAGAVRHHGPGRRSHERTHPPRRPVRRQRTRSRGSQGKGGGTPPLSCSVYFGCCYGNGQHEESPSASSSSQFSPDQPVIPSQTLGYAMRPSLKEQIHCVAFVLDASKLSAYPQSLRSSFLQLREHISELGEGRAAAPHPRPFPPPACLSPSRPPRGPSGGPAHAR